MGLNIKFLNYVYYHCLLSISVKTMMEGGKHSVFFLNSPVVNLLGMAVIQ